MRYLTFCLWIICHAFLIQGHEIEGYGGGNTPYDAYLLRFKSFLTDVSWNRVRDLVHRFGAPAGSAVMSAYEEIAPWLPLNASALESFLCNKVKSAVQSPTSLSYHVLVSTYPFDACRGTNSEGAQIFSAAEQQLAQRDANEVEVKIALSGSNRVFTWLRKQPMSYNNWASREPPSYPWRSCVVMKSNGEWKATSCDTQHVLCEERPIVCASHQLPPLNEKYAKNKTEDEYEYPMSGDKSALTDRKTRTNTFELSMDLSYDLVKNNSVAFVISFYKAVREIIHPKLIIVKRLRSGSTIITFTLTASKNTLPIMTWNLKKACKRGHFKMTFMNTEVRPTPGSRLKEIKSEEDDGEAKIFAYVFIAFVVAFILSFPVMTIYLKLEPKIKKLCGRTAANEPTTFSNKAVANSNGNLTSGQDAPPSYADVTTNFARTGQGNESSIFWVNGTDGIGSPPEAHAPPTYSANSRI